MSELTQRQILKVSQLLEDLRNGYTRTNTDKGYQGEGKSIQEKYGLTKMKVKEIFQHPSLKGRKTIIPSEPTFELIDDTVENTVENVDEGTTNTTDTSNTPTNQDQSMNDEGNSGDDNSSEIEQLDEVSVSESTSEVFN